MYYKYILCTIFLISVCICEENDGKSSLAFVFDTTGSMYNDLKQLREGAEMILNTALKESDVIKDFVFVPFHDPLYGPATVTKNKAVFKRALNIVNVYGGGDCPEQSLHGIHLALNASRPRSFLYVFTDATAADHKIVGTVLDTIQRKQSQVVFILTGHCNDLQRPSYKVYQQVAAASSGQIFNLNKTNVHKMLEFVKSSIKGRSVNLASVSNPAGYNYTQEIPIDSTLGEVTVSVSGAKPKITVVDPKGETVTGPPKLITTLDLSEIMVVKVLQPEPGNWTITVGSEKEHSVKVVGLSNVTFIHGFSVENPRSMKETSYRPLQGTYNHLMISLTQSNAPVDIFYAEILNLSGKTLFELPLKKLDERTYIVEPFIPPNEFFYIAINGRDQYNQELRRIGATAIQAKLPDVPYLSAPRKVKARRHDQVTLTCNVESLVPVTAQWTKDDSRTRLQLSSLQTTSIDLVIEDMSEEHVGTYRCVANNVAGTSNVVTELGIIVEPPLVTIGPGDLSTDLGDNVTISCIVYSEALLLDCKLTFEGTQRRHEMEINKNPNLEGVYLFNKTIQITSTDVGKYSCIATNRGGTTNQSMKISLKAKPTAQIIGPHTIPKHIDSGLQIVCAVENAERISWTAPNGTIVREIAVNGSLNDMLDINNVSDDGVWTCNAIRGSVKKSDSVTIIVLLKPVVSILGPKNITIVNGTIHEIHCDVVAKPPPRILWHRETEDFLNNTIVQIEPNKYRSIMLLDSRKDSVQNTYFCFGENSEGIHQDSVTIKVRRRMTEINGLKDHSVLLYSQIELHCKVDSYPPPQILWFHNDTIISTNVNITEDNSTVYIKRVDFDNLGMYKCIADNGFEKMKLKGTLSVYGLASPVLSKDPKQLVIKEGDSATIACRVLQGNPDPAILWQYKRNSEDFASLPANVLVNNDRKELVITKVVVEHSGVFRCVAQNVVGEDNYDVNTIVQFSPKLSMTSEEDKPYFVNVGGNVSFSCEATALPAAIIVWTKDGRPLLQTEHLKLVNTSYLVIKKASEYHSGVYTCNVTNTIGFTLKNYTLFVYDPPKIKSSPDLIKDVIEGQLVELICKASGVPLPVVEWTHNGSPITDSRKFVDDFGLRFVSNLTDFGEYTCIAKNEFGNTSVTYTLQVWVPPQITPPMETTMSVLLGANVSIQCDVMGFPIPTIQWQFNGEMLIKNTTDLSFNEIGNLYITNVRSNHEGTYVCIAENIGGIAEKITHLKVSESPKIIDDNYTGSYVATNMDKLLTVSCKATGKPKPFIVWSKEELYLDNDSRYNIDVDGSLIIKSPTEDMTGDYVCTAKNAVGVDNKTVHVEIYALPRNMQSEESLHTITLVEGRNETIDCPIQTSHHSVKWYKNAQLISTGSLQLLNISRNDASTYSCVVINAVGSAYAKLLVVVEWAPRFRSGRESVVEVVKGDDWVFDCGVDAKPKAKAKWLINSKPVIFEDKEYLKLINVHPRNEGMYQCVVSNKHGTVHRKFVLKVLEAPFISDFDVMDVQLKEGMNASLECNAVGTPTPNIKWTYNNSYWHEHNSILSTTTTSQSEGIFRCDATNKAGAAYIVYRVTVIAAPRVQDIVVYVDGVASNVEGNVDVVLGSNIRISCKASGSPIADIQWIKQGRTVSENQYDINYADLIINNVGNSHAGVYTCVASNEGGSDEKRITVSVLEPPKIFHTLFQNTTANEIILEVLSDQAFFLHCHPYGNPYPQIYWFKDDIPLKLFDDTMVSSDFGEVLVVKRALQSQSGNYTCVARNSVGNTSVVYLVDVLVPPPQPKESTKKVTTIINKDIKLKCPVEGSPLPLVMWIKHPYDEITEDTHRVTLSDDRVTLSIKLAETTDSGNYTCIMTNKVGTTQMTYDVTVLKPPTIMAGVEGHVVQLGRSLVLKCEADGYPVPKITWLKDTQPLSDNLSNIQFVLGASVVAIWRVRVPDAGHYICVLENDAGTANRRFNVALQVPGKWSNWSQWSYCNATCGLGYQRRTRVCHYTDERNNTIDSTTKSDRIILDTSACKGPNVDRRKCHMPPCEVESSKPRWSAWSRWSECSATCGFGSQARTRRCKTKAACVGDNVQIKKCTDLPPCFTSTESTNDVAEEKENISDINSYLPEATFELQPEVNSMYSPDIEEFYSASGSQPSTAFYDVKVTSNLDHSPQGPCDPGYRHDKLTGKCEDVNECELAKNQCHGTQVCMNTLGAYRCSCPAGYLSLGAGQRCMDVNECELSTDGCEYSCVNTAGGYVCACPKSLRLHLDRHHCVTPALYRQPFGEPDAEYLSTTVDFPTRYMKPNKNN